MCAEGKLKRRTHGRDMNTPEELKSQTKAKSEPEEYGPDDFSGSVQRTQLKAEGPADMKNKLKDKNTITNEKRGLSQPKVDRTARKQRSTETRTRRNETKIEAMNGLENHHYTMQNTLTEGQLKDKFEHDKYGDSHAQKRSTLKHCRSEGLRVPRREGSVNVSRAQDPYTAVTTQDQHHAQGLALCHDVTLDIVTHQWVPAGHPQYTGARKGRLWVAQAQTQAQLTLLSGPQSLTLKCQHGSGAEGSTCCGFLVAWERK